MLDDDLVYQVLQKLEQIASILRSAQQGVDDENEMDFIGDGFGDDDESEDS